MPASGTPQPVFRPATLTDCPCLAALSIQVWLHTYATEGLRAALADYVLSEFTPGHFMQILADPATVLWVMEVNQHLVGYARLSFDTPCPGHPQYRTELVTLYLQAHFLGKGLGAQLLARCRDCAHQRDRGTALWLTVYSQNTRALAFYRRQGFGIGGQNEFEFGGERHPNLILLAPSGVLEGNATPAGDRSH